MQLAGRVREDFLVEGTEAKPEKHTSVLGSSSWPVSLSKGVCRTEPRRWGKKGTSVGKKSMTLAEI